MRYLLPGRAAWAVSLTRTIVALVTLFSVATQLAALSVQPSTATFSLDTTTLTIPQVDYESAIYYRDGDPYPHLDFERVDRRRTVRKDHTAVVMENRYVKLTLLPEMGRVYSFVYKPTGHETLWQNDLVTVGGAANDTGWWLWIGGVEYTLPGDEHGTTWAMPWSWEIIENSSRRKAVRMRVREPGTGLEESIEIAIVSGRAFFEARICITNPTDGMVEYAHWVNPQWTPGGQNELTDRTEFIIPTDRILIDERWQENLGPSPQAWQGNPLRFIRGWSRMGDVMADGLTGGFYSAYSHDADEGIVRVFDPDKTPGVDVWTYGYHPTQIPMGSGGPNAGYVEMWGGTSRTYPDERWPLAPDASLQWTEWMYPYQRTQGLTFANEDVAINFQVTPEARRVVIGLCPSGEWRGAVELWRESVHDAADGRAPLRRWEVTADPATPFIKVVILEGLMASEFNDLRLRVGSDQDGWTIVEAEN